MSETRTPVKHTGLCRAELVRAAVDRGEGRLAANGALVVTTGRRTARHPEDKFIVREPGTDEMIQWNAINQPFDPDAFDELWYKVKASVVENDHFVERLHVGASPDHYLPLTLTAETAWHCLFAQNLFAQPHSESDISEYNPKEKKEWRLLHAPSFVCDPAVDGTASDGCVIINFARRRILLAGMPYAGELKKAVFTVQNFLLPEKDILPMQCAANADDQGRVCLLFGLTGTGKTTLSADPTRHLIGDDEHGWGRDILFNLEAGCYAKCINLTREHEPVIFDAIRDGAIVENVVLSSQGEPDYADASLTENARASYGRDHVEGYVDSNMGPEPETLIFLCCDLTGVVPAVSILSPEAAAYHFLSGYTARVGSAEAAGDASYTPTFSSCYGAPFFPRPTETYAKLLMRRMEEAGSRAYLVNTGWIGDSYDEGGRRTPLAFTRRIISAIQAGELVDVPTQSLSPLNLRVPLALDGISAARLNPRNLARDAANFDARAEHLAQQFRENFMRYHMPSEIAEAGPIGA